MGRVSKQTMHLSQGEFQCSVYHDVVEGGTHLALVKGEISQETVTPVRVHVHRGLLDSVLSPATNWSWTLKNALDAISKQSSGVVVILSYNESVDELVSRIDLYNNNRRRRPSTLISANETQQNPANLRMLGAGGQILADLGVTRVLALGRQKKAHGLSGFGLEIVDYIESPEQLAQWNKEKDDEVR